jgi:hypothetical protein
MDKMKILLRVIKIGAVIGVAIPIYILTLSSAVIAELYLLGLVFPGVIHSEILTKLVTLTLTCVTGGIIAVTGTYLLQKHMERKGLI